eukprot:Gregarina_sp_Poly_1__1059@NODE_125_length_13444_cov_91_472378_g111_i0_p1_GENE_NODE_125_length_13444_cov_91_472378_g111_i0NODE_125_length_13444_cov_91_472378_g111_i0_p1_ORF_typecomplete_len972_score134_79HECT/PF00632_25/7_6e83_NODE_125_length_13444_cov_91_472378_g111_i0836211277
MTSASSKVHLFICTVPRRSCVVKKALVLGRKKVPLRRLFPGARQEDMTSASESTSADRICFLWENLLLASTQIPCPSEAHVIREAAELHQAGVSLNAFLLPDENEANEYLQQDLSKVRDLKVAAVSYEASVRAFRAFKLADQKLERFFSDPKSILLVDLISMIDNIMGSLVGLGHFARDEGHVISNAHPSVDLRKLQQLYSSIEAYDAHICSLYQSNLDAPVQTPADTQGAFGIVRITEFNRVQKYVMKVIGNMAEKCQNLCPSFSSALQVRFFIIFLNCPFFGDALEFSGFLEICRCATKISEIGKQILRSWFVHCPLSELDQHAESIREMITVRVCEHLGSADRFGSASELEGIAAPYIRHGLSLLQILYDANIERRSMETKEEMTVEFYRKQKRGIDLHPDTLKPLKANSLPRTEFYNDGINQKIEIIFEDFKEWHRQSDHYTFGVLEHPFVLDAAGKACLLAFDSNMRQKIESSRSLPFRFRGSHLYLEVRRDRLVEDALNQLTRAQGGGRRLNSSRLKNPFRVKFVGEEGVDQGGVAKEFFQLLVQELFNVEYGMFNYHEETRYFSFKPDSLEGLVQFELIGMVLGLALYNQIILDIHFPLVVYKKLLSGNDSVLPPPNGPPPQPWRAFQVTGQNVPPSTRGLTPTKVDGAQPSSGDNGTEERATGREGTSGGTNNMLGGERIAFLSAIVLGSQPEIARWRLSPGAELSELEMVQKMAYTLPPYEPCLEDLEDYEPQLVTNLRKLLELPAEMVQHLGLTWSISTERFGEMIDIPLCPQAGDDNMDRNSLLGGAECPVTADNREAYVKAILKYRLVDCAKEQFDAFYKGFHRCCGGPVLELFDAAELNLVICGSPGDLDFDDLEKGARYDGFTPDSPIVRNFWEIAHNLSQEDKKKLLFFVTGSDRTPVAGLSSIKMIIAKGGGDKSRLPTARTCFNYLLLPDYETKGELEQRLRLALENRQGFFLE